MELLSDLTKGQIFMLLEKGDKESLTEVLNLIQDAMKSVGYPAMILDFTPDKLPKMSNGTLLSSQPGAVPFYSVLPIDLFRRSAKLYFIKGNGYVYSSSGKLADTSSFAQRIAGSGSSIEAKMTRVLADYHSRITSNSTVPTATDLMKL